MRVQDYIITTTQGARSRKRFWNGRTPLDLDYPVSLSLRRTAEGLELKRRIVENGVRKESLHKIPADAAAQGTRFRLKQPTDKNPDRTFEFCIQSLRPLKASYLPSSRAEVKKDGQFFIFWGTRYYLSDFRALGKSFTAHLGNKDIFRLEQKPTGYEIVALVESVRFKIPGEFKQDMEPGQRYVLTTQQLQMGGIQWNKHWWRMNVVHTPEKLPLAKMEAEEIRDRSLFNRMLMASVAGFAIFALTLLTFKIPEHPLIPPEPTAVTLKLPKIIQEAKHIEKKKVVELKPKKTLTKPKKVQKKTMVASKPKPTKKLIAQVAPPKVVQPPVEVKPDPAQIAAKARAQLAQSLSFLAPSSAKPVSNIQNDKVNSKYNTVGNVDDIRKANTSVLNNITQSAKLDGPIETKNARNIKSDIGGQKGLNEVQGRVSIGDIQVADAGELNGVVSGTGMSVDGPGQLDDSEIEKALKKYLEKFQYCYEKELLTDNTLAGLVQMQWTISTQGNATDVKILRSQLKKESLHNCLSKQLAKILFPSPKGGEVVIKYPFKFSNSSL